MAPRQSTISGRAWVSDQMFIAVASLHQGCGFRRAQSVLVVVEQRRDRRRRYVEHGLRIEDEQQREDDQRREYRDLAQSHVVDVRQARLLQLAKDHLAVEPKRV